MNGLKNGFGAAAAPSIIIAAALAQRAYQARYIVRAALLSKALNVAMMKQCGAGAHNEKWRWRGSWRGGDGALRRSAWRQRCRAARWRVRRIKQRRDAARGIIIMAAAWRWRSAGAALAPRAALCARVRARARRARAWRAARSCARWYGVAALARWRGAGAGAAAWRVLLSVTPSRAQRCGARINGGNNNKNKKRARICALVCALCAYRNNNNSGMAARA